MNNLLSGFFREGPAATPSMTRLVLFLCAWSACIPLIAWSLRYVWFGAAPDLPGGIIAASGAVLTLAAGLKGWERQAVEQTKQQEAKRDAAEGAKG